MSSSSTKRRASAAELHALTARAFGPGGQLTSAVELTEGSYNAVYAVTVDDRPLVLKISPPPGLKLLTHEVDLLRTEVEYYRRAGPAGTPVPEVVYADHDRSVIECDFMFMSRVDGVPLNGAGLAGSVLADLRRRITTIACRAHRVTGTRFGYPQRGSRTWQTTWRGAFGAMIDDVLADAARLGSTLPAPPDRIAALLRRHADALDEVRRPALVHFDLWDGNVFVTPSASGGWEVAGLIDGERAFYGDPLAELVSLALLRDLPDAPEVLAGYTDAHGTEVDLDGAEGRRITLYTSYLYLIMAIEGATRGWAGPEQEEREAGIRGLLDAQLARL
ncbi:phosphotransferase family protein [Rhizomonospora bruguierae]|uniref:phosphotransferase family protein n=1 Tax=Rhizomonospora bruguierae TaxID=1581705 RepID=UPI001BCC80B3|nr:aminoglycoside phosphotransferase family protein [Micromonospora sp. NBRC 107566]